MKAALRKLKFQSRKAVRQHEIWAGIEYIPKNCQYIFGQCCGACTPYPAMYKLTGSHVRIIENQAERCLGLKCACLGTSHRTNNIDLSMVKDVDLSGVDPGPFERFCCCDSGTDLITISVDDAGSGSGDASINLIVIRHGEGKRVADLIIDAREEATLRDARGGGHADKA